ncbi:MAG: acylneuraminate cytidylyltransferase [Pseudomonadota bacterium]
MKRKLVAALACRNKSTRLFGKPMQYLNIDARISVLEHIIDLIQTLPEVNEVILGIAEGDSNLSFIETANKKNVQYIIGKEEDVLGRLLQCADATGATDIFRVTSESPFIFFNAVREGWEKHLAADCDLTKLDYVPDGSGFEIIKTTALRESHKSTDDKEHSEHCSLYIRENKDKFKVIDIEAPDNIRRMDIRLTIDNPEDLVLCRAVYEYFKSDAPRIPLDKIIAYLDEKPELTGLVAPYIEVGLSTMYK